MSRPVINTHAGDDSDGKLWGVDILFIVAGLLLSVGLSLMVFRQQVHSSAFSFGVGSLPFVLASVCVFALRQGGPHSYDTDLLETLLAGRAWLPPRWQPRHPLRVTMKAANDWICHDLFIWNELDRRWFCFERIRAGNSGPAAWKRSRARRLL